MSCLFPEIEEQIKEQDRRTLYIIGNGFDLASGIATSYGDFYQWLKENKYDHLIQMMDIFFNNSDQDLWSDIEKILGEYDEDHILEFCKPEGDIDYDHPTRYMASVEDAPDWLFQPVLDVFIEAFRNWVDNIDITTATKIRTLPTESIYLTFNYTETLERVYSIPESNVLHIHGYRLLNKNYIIGHNNYRDPNDGYIDDTEMSYIQDTLSKIIESMNSLLKDTTAIIREHQNFFNSLANIERVIVYGLSFNEVDWPYMKEIVRHIGIEKQWHISQHCPEDFKKIHSFINDMGLKNVRTFDM